MQEERRRRWWGEVKGGEVSPRCANVEEEEGRRGCWKQLEGVEGVSGGLPMGGHDAFRVLFSFFSSALRSLASLWAKNICVCRNAWKKGRSAFGVWSRKLKEMLINSSGCIRSPSPLSLSSSLLLLLFFFSSSLLLLLLPWVNTFPSETPWWVGYWPWGPWCSACGNQRRGTASESSSSCKSPPPNDRWCHLQKRSLAYVDL